mmetsp:Transcript_2088/g.6236  ORF Transcript_2088/g.6236 Transcript_2088/m.6236 type:complete len:477 (+) Transcript_2088:170-1600(+)|eukprot:CAMPEP_0198733888 /NCGR_PEP_ID=MMETSP1475-20131203/48995_1 /TAXON_ID= ORGANISM="Unidentified sp., Strain CCMP1999" /NCGR_SAMPLE_ID=MMETSP1475 /ASSEMBLY_ACC=CAM_ASM_001111 /LENGTH=476 /DNA_ID=CAMNT_0044497259 /DNA_START=152 /DNA_END=1582 /DNA_ORIENTATION=+
MNGLHESLSDSFQDGLLAEADVSEELVQRADALRKALNVPPGKVLHVVGLGAGAWGSVFISMLQKQYRCLKDKVKFSIWRREGKKLNLQVAGQILESINRDSEVIRRLKHKGRYLKYVDARLGDRTLSADEVLTDGFCENMLEMPLRPLTVVTDLFEAVWDADIIINSIPSTDIRSVFGKIGNVVKERERIPIVVSLAKGVEFISKPNPHILTPSGMIHEASGIPRESIFYLGGPNIASEVWRGEYATARICGGEEAYRTPLAEFFRNSSFVVWDNPDIVNHEVMGGLKNVYAIGAGIIKAAAHNSATSMAVYFSNACAEMVFISHLITGVRDPVYLAGPLLADVYVTLLKGRNAWYGEQLALGTIKVIDGPYVPGKGLIQGISAVSNFHELLSDERLNVPDPLTGEKVLPITLLPTLSALQEVLTSAQKSTRGHVANPGEYFLNRMKDDAATDPEKRLKISTAVFIPNITEALCH